MPPLSMKLDRTASIIILETRLFGPNGKCRIEMALDTGATYTMIPWDVTEILGYDPTKSRERIILTTASTIEKGPLITLERIKIFDVEVENVKVAVHDLPPKSRVDGLLGLSFLKHFNIDLHFKEGLLEFKDP